jgi:hypothetical protein
LQNGKQSVAQSSSSLLLRNSNTVPILQQLALVADWQAFCFA